MPSIAAKPRPLLEQIWDGSPAPQRNLLRWGNPDRPRLAPLLGLAAMLILLAGLLIQLPTPALHGDGLAALIGLGLVIGAFAVELIADPASVRWVMCFGLMVGFGSAIVALVQPGGTAVIGCYVAVGISARRLPKLNAAIVAIPLSAFVMTVILLSADNAVFTTLWSGLGFGFTFMISRIARVGEEQHARERALIEEEKSALGARTEAAALAERSRIAREMHDVLAHSLSALSVELEGARLLARSRDADPEIETAIERAHQHATTGLAEARAAIEALRGDDLPGPERLETMARSFATEQEVRCEFEVSGEVRPLASEANLAIYRTAQEALTNVRKHADPQRVDLRLIYGDEGTQLEVVDHGQTNGNGNGSGSLHNRALANAGSGYGVSGMRERAELLGGRLVAGPTADGFLVELWLPHASRS